MASIRFQGEPARAVLLGVVLGVVLLAPLVARADVGVGVLGVSSQEGDDQISADLTAALRLAVQGIPGYRLNPREVTLSQMTLAHDCPDVPDEACLARIGEALAAERLVYGTMRRVASGSDYRFRVTFAVFNVVTRHIELTFPEDIPRDHASADVLRVRARGVARRLLGMSATGGGTLEIRSSVLASVVSLDGTEVGQTGDGPLVLHSVEPGRHRIHVTSPGYAPFDRAVIVTAGETQAVQAGLEQLGTGGAGGHGRGHGEDHTLPGSDLRWIGWVTAGIGVALGAAALLEYIQYRDQASTWSSFHATVTPEELSRCHRPADDDNACMIDDICQFVQEPAHASQPGAPEVALACRDRSQFLTPARVLFGVSIAVVAIGTVGIILLGPGEQAETTGRRARVRHARRSAHAVDVVPSFGPSGAGVSASITF